MKCWICGGEGTTREHLFKASDIRQLYGDVTSKRPLYKHTDNRRNQILQSAKSKVITSKALICAHCNNQRTQPYDNAWLDLSGYLLNNWASISRRGGFDLSKVFPGSTNKAAICVHLYFVKLFGCRIVEDQIPIDIAPFSSALMNGTAHEEVHLVISESPFGSDKVANVSEIHAMNANGFSDSAGWMYTFSPVSIFVGYMRKESKQKLWPNTWHPNRTGKFVKLGAYKK